MQLSGPDRERGGAWVSDVIGDDHGHRWTVDVWLAIRSGRLVVGEVRVFPAAGPPRVTAGFPWRGTAADVPRGGLERRLLVRVPVGRFVLAVLARAAAAALVPGPSAGAVTTQGANLGWLNRILPGVETLAPRPRERRNVGRDDRFYARLALEYLQTIASGSSSPVKDVAAKHGEKASRIRDQIHEARVRGLLSQGEAGKRGGYLLPRARQMLGEKPATRRKKPAARSRRRG
jgi:hypothetical protein